MWHTGPSIGEVEKVEHWVEEFIAGTHAEEERAGSVVELEECILLLIHGFMRGLSKDSRSVEGNPVAGNVHHHHQLKEKDERWVESAQCGQQAHCGTTICQHVQHSSKFGTYLNDKLLWFV